MAVQNKSKTILNINTPDGCINKVYINPNFNKPHVNPKFSHLVPNVQEKMQNKIKIYVNPHFIKTSSVSNNCISNSSKNEVVPDKSTVNRSMTTCNQQYVLEEVNLPMVPISQNRYCLVRQHEANKLIKEPTLEANKKTFKLNKYKTVPWNDIKRNINNENHVEINKLTYRAPHINMNSSISMNVRKNEFKFINYKNSCSVKQDKLRTKLNTNTHDTYKKVYKFNQANQSKVKAIKVNLKKNNIPCPLFRKFGKCLRNARGNCEFLHDKKHVSICRKFIKGLCHDKDCLLSHDLTSKKMPTCYFYLQGTCTKTECPYLHVKLNEKAKICSDFVKGYCEKGSKCLHRHIDVTIEKKKSKLNTQTTASVIKNKYNETKIRRFNMKSTPYKKKEELHNVGIKSVCSAELCLVDNEPCSENRYYEERREQVTTNEFCEVIKPVRCKLGTLPSFIQL